MSNSLSNITQLFRGFPGSSEVKNLPAKQETQVPSLEKKMATHPSILAWRIPMDREAWQATVHRVAKELEHDLASKQQLASKKDKTLSPQAVSIAAVKHLDTGGFTFICRTH